MKTKPSVLLIGAGQLGSRYLQGLVPIIDMLKINVVDHQNSSLEKADKLISETFGSTPKQVRFFKNIEEINTNSADLVIISSTSKGRADLINEVKNSFNPKYWIIEKVLEQSIKNIEKIEKNLTYFNEKAWVNNGRRIMEFHKKILKEIKIIKSSRIPLNFVYEGSNWGLGCNAIHFIDLVSWWTGEKDFKIINTKFDKWLPSKRNGYFEPFGELVVKYNDGSTLSLICKEKSYSEKDILLKVFKKDKLLIEINEAKGEATFINEKTIYGNIELQSEMTSRLVTNILKNGKCELTTLNESIYQHKLLIKSLSLEWSKFSKNIITNDFAPVT